MDSDAALTWPVRLTFLRYISTLPDGQAVLDRGARVTPGLGIVFPLDRADVDAASGDGSAWFTGEVHFVGHHGLLDIRLADPCVHVAGGVGSLAVATGRGHRQLATCTVTSEPDTAGRWSATDVRLTEWGAGVFGDVYADGEPLDPFTAVLAR